MSLIIPSVCLLYQTGLLVRVLFPVFSSAFCDSCSISHLLSLHTSLLFVTCPLTRVAIGNFYLSSFQTLLLLLVRGGPVP